ncbi:MAG: metallophosphoesterase [Nanoarchaeota archaeon]
MKFLAFADLHEDKRFLKQLLERARQEDVEFLVCAGDLTQFGRNLRYVLKQFNDLGKKLYLIPGNHESDKMLSEVLPDYPNCSNFNCGTVEKGGYIFLGYGEGGFSSEDSAFRRVAREWYGKYNGKKLVLVTHGPPFGTKADFLDNQYIGNKDFRAFIERIKPKLAICGHIHETAGAVDKIGATNVINPGWEGMIVELS